MIKGAQKQMIVVRTGDSRYFDEAYSVLRRGIAPDRSEKSDILSEANRILCESETARPLKRARRGRPIWLFLLGAAVGGGVAALICLLILL